MGKKHKDEVSSVHCPGGKFNWKYEKRCDRLMAFPKVTKRTAPWTEEEYKKEKADQKLYLIPNNS